MKSNPLIIIAKGSLVKSAINSVIEVARNASTEEDRLINFMCHNDAMFVTATDSSNEAQVSLTVNSTISAVFALNANKINQVIESDSTVRFEIYEERILVSQDLGEVDLPRFNPNMKPFMFEKNNFETIPLQKFLSNIKAMYKYLTPDISDSGVMILNGENLYIRNKLFYGISDFKTENQYVFNRMSCKCLINTFNPSVYKGKTNLYIKVNKLENKIEVSDGDNNLRIPFFANSPIDLTKLNQIREINGFVVSKENILKSLRSIKNLVDDCVDVDLISEVDRILVKPKVSTSNKTNFKVPAQYLKVEEETNQNKILLTVNLSSLENLVKGTNVDELLLSSSVNNNILMITTKSDINAVRFYISVY